MTADPQRGPKNAPPLWAGALPYPEIQARWPILALAALSYLLCLPIFEPNAVWFLAYVAFVPWLIALRLARRGAFTYLVSFAFGAAFWATHTRWFLPLSVPVCLVFTLVLAGHFLLAVWPIRHLARRRALSLTFVFPVVWAAEELFHSRGTFSFAWCLLGHTQIRLPVMIQIADLAGAMGVSFLVGAVNGWVADAVLALLAFSSPLNGGGSACGRATFPPPLGGGGSGWGRPRLLVPTLAVLTLVAGALLYGRFRLAERPWEVGPRVAVLHADFPLRSDIAGTRAISDPPPPDDELDGLIREQAGAYEADKRLAYLSLLDEAAATGPDLLVLPEVPWSMVLNREHRQSPQAVWDLAGQLQHEEFVALAKRYRASILVGAQALEPQPPGGFPAVHKYNAAFLYRPGEDEPARYNKISPVLFGEHLPFRFSRRLFWIYRWLNDASWNAWGHGGKEYVLTGGLEHTTFASPARSSPGTSANSAQPQSFRFAAPICHEHSIAQQFRQFVVGPDGRKRVDFMLNISNLAWFPPGSQQAQDLAICAFRAVENRVWIARATDANISGFIDPDGQWHDLAGGPGAAAGVAGMAYRTAQVRLDPRVTFYSRHGDWLAWTCAAASLLACLDAVILWLRKR